MAEPEWTTIFQIKANQLKQGDSWRLEFDENLEPNCPIQGWKQYIRNSSACFKCTACGRGWPSNRVMVVFHMHLINGRGIVKVRRFRQNCKMCSEAPMENPIITPENINILMENLMVKIRIKCYNEDMGESHKPFRTLDVKSPHEPAHCEACIKGICTQN